MKRFAIAMLFLLATLAAYGQTGTYMVMESHASRFVCKGMACTFVPSTYVLKHGTVLIRAHCDVLIRWEGHYDSCEHFPDPEVPVGENLNMSEHGNSIDWVPVGADGRSYADGVGFAVDSRKVR